MSRPDLTKRIVYQNDSGGVSIIIPCDCGLSVEIIANKDVPTGKPYAIVDSSEIPEDRSGRKGWFVSLSDLNDGVGS